MPRACAWLALVFAISFAAAARAQQAQPEAAPQQFVSLTISPLHLIFPVVELTAELRVSDLLGLALVGGIGSISAKTSSGDKLSFSAYELGAQAVVYPLEPFESLQVGAEFLYLQVAVEDEIGDQQVSGLGAGLAIGPLVGYKLLTSVGFTFFVQGGVSFVALQAEAQNELGESASRDENRVLPLLNLNLGWSM